MAVFYRRRFRWLIGLMVTLLLGAIGYGLLDRTRSHEPTGAAPAAATISPISLVPVSITRTGKEITLQGEFPDAKARAALLDAVVESVGSTANVVDNLGINPDVNSLDFSDAALVFNTAAAIPDFRLSAVGDTVTLAGTAATAEQADAVLQAAEDTWPDLHIDNRITAGAS
ncbi:channel-forming protein ArfA/OmpATb [Mycobacterium shimoidei]|uniref:Outer membrane protein A OmpA [Mycobacterium tuberculosis H37Rv] n=1 Tax=Mycobacterium shimoidei TaxID=29313 RepID=A0A375YYI2_MYCSH|nr:BON domain-containing protein [Mycobacterium shimoidei]MCV7258451.1 BON domain-containing protein [Mycobacterium shimoidei]SRX93795.1 Outer membrane protein A OmpA [Mycobacterium tuberculosis H37Rv] [Mycobacterium shimoidei]